MAAIKMDELLVSWLSSDGVYESILSMIESNRTMGSSSSGGGGGSGSPVSPTRSARKSTINSEAASANPSAPPSSDGDSSNTNTTGGGAGGADSSVAADPDDDPYASPTPSTTSRKVPSPTISPGSGTKPPTSPKGRRGSGGGGQPPPPPAAAAATARVTIPKFYNPQEGGRGRGRRPPPEDNQSWSAVEVNKPVLRQVFTSGQAAANAAAGAAAPPSDDPSLVLSMAEFLPITKEVCNFPSFFNAPLYRRILLLSNEEQEEQQSGPAAQERHAGGASTPVNLENTAASGISYKMFERYWTAEMEPYDPHDRFFRLVKKPYEEYVTREDFLPFIEELLASHPGLEFLSNHAEFQEKYAVTVITRIFYSVSRHGGHNGKVTARQVRRSNLLEAFHLVDTEEDINKVTQYFSYEHFYVLYCRFWELDHDRDYLITREDLLKYGDHSLSHMIVDRIFDAAPRPFESSSIVTTAAAQQLGGDAVVDAKAAGGGGTAINREYLSYEDFIFFMLSEEDKANEVSVRYWFTCIDVDGDGKLNNMEMRSFYAVQLHRMQCLGHEIVPFEDMLCQMMDMIKPANQDYLVVEDFLQPECAQVSGALFDALFNLNKYLQFEQRDPFMERQKREDEFDCDWDRFACMDYNRLAMEEEAREEEAMEIDWVTVDDDEDDGDDFNSLGLGGASEAPF